MRKFYLIPAAIAGLLSTTVLSQDRATAPLATENRADPNDSKPSAMSRDSALRKDAEALAAARGIPIGQALKAVKAQEDLGDEIGRLRDEFRGRVAGIHVEHSPEYRIVVRLKGSGKVSARTLQKQESSVPVEFVDGASATVEEMVTDMMAALPQIKALLPTLQGLGTDEKTGEVVLNVYAVGAGASVASGKRDDVAKLVGHPVRIEIVQHEERSADVRGGSKIAASSGSYCTTGFSVKNTAGTTGITTAGHCEGMNTYYNPNGSSIALTFATEVLDADQDVEVHTSGYVERPEFYADSTTTARVLTGKRLRSSTGVGNQVCHRGETTGYSCGLVAQTNYAPTYAGACGSQTCLAVFVKVNGDANTACDQGDSGGSVFASQTAFGLLKSTLDGGSAKGQCTYFTYMSTDTLPTGWSLLYGP